MSLSLKAGKLIEAKYIPIYASEYSTPPTSAPSTPRETGLPEVEGEVSKVKSDTLCKYNDLLSEPRELLGERLYPVKPAIPSRLASLSRCTMYPNASRSLRPSPLLDTSLTSLENNAPIAGQ
jgi:hypothetical protein